MAERKVIAEVRVSKKAAGGAPHAEVLEGGTEGASADILDSPNALVGIHYFVTDLKSHHTGSPTNHRCQVLPLSFHNNS